MSYTFSDAKKLIDSLCEPFGDYAPKKRCLIADYKDANGTDANQYLTVYHNRNSTDESLVESVRQDLAGQGCTLTALGEFTADGKQRALYLAPGYLEEFAAEMGLTMPGDIAAALTAAGVHPVNWEELTHGG